MFSLLDLAALLLGFSALFGWLSRRFLPLPSSIGQLGMGLLASLLIVAADAVLPEHRWGQKVIQAVANIDFEATVMNGLLAFLLFAGALHLNVASLRGRAVPVALLASLGVVVSTAVIGIGLWQAAQLLGVDLSLPWALVFGALISPTDPVAVLGTLKSVAVPLALETDMKGEALFNDGVGVVIFTVLLAVATGAQTSPGELSVLFAREALGGVALGLATGYVAYRMTRAVDEYALEVTLSLALATGTYALAQALGTSGPIAVVVAGLVLGSRGAEFGMSERTRRYVFGVWEVIDTTLNSVLFLLIGLEVLVVRFQRSIVPLVALAVPLALAGRLVSVAVGVGAMRHWIGFPPRTIAVLTWGGLRGGISIALALSLPDMPAKPALLAATYAVSIFSLLVQGSTLGLVARRRQRPADA